MQNRLLTIAITVFFLVPATAFGQQDPSALKEQANAQVMAGSDLMQEGMAIVQRRGASEQDIRAAIGLLVQAGQRFEKAAQIYQALVPDYASQQDVENSMKAVQTCITTIQRLKQSL